MTTTFNIIRAMPKDASVLTHITVEAKRYWKYPEKWIHLWLPQLTITVEYISNHEVWMAVAEDAVVGYYSLEYLNDELWLGNLWVLPEHMGRELVACFLSILLKDPEGLAFLF